MGGVVRSLQPSKKAPRPSPLPEGEGRGEGAFASAPRHIRKVELVQCVPRLGVLEAVPRSKDDQQHLDLDGQSHVIVVSNQTFLQDGRQFEYTESRHTLDKFYFSDIARR